MKNVHSVSQTGGAALADACDDALGVPYGSNSASATPTSAVSYPLTPVTVNVQTATGYSFTVQLNYGPVIPWSDAADSAAAWQSVGGTGTPPCVGSNPDYVANYNPATSGHSYGTLKVTNNIPTFVPSLVAIATVAPQLSTLANGWTTSCGGSCASVLGAGTKFLEPQLQNNQAVWGPVPFDLAIGDYTSPNNPDGDPAILAKQFTIEVGSGSPTTSNSTFSLTPFSK